MAGSVLFTLAPYHILSYGTLLGTTFFHTFINGTVLFRVLERPQFGVATSHLFPIYFSMQTALPVILAVTYPGSKNPFGPASGLSGFFDPSNRWAVLAPLTVAFATGLVNLVVLLPTAQKILAERKLQEKKDGKKSYDPPPRSQEMIALNKRFGMIHGISSLLNITTFVSALIYGVTLSARLS